MVLFIDGQRCPSDLSVDRLADYPDLIARSSQLANSAEIEQPPEEVARTIYAAQREFAVLNRTDRHGFHLLGSDEATTCHLLILDNHLAVALAHLDGTETQRSIEEICRELELYAPDENDYDLYLAGGFLDSSSAQYSRHLSDEVLQALTEMPQRTFHLKLAAITMYNDHLIDGVHFPLIYGLCFDVQNNSIRRMRFKEFGPAFRLRSVYHSVHSHSSYCLYSSIRARIVLKRFQIERNLVEQYFRRLHKYCFHDEPRLLTLTSTSPAQERPTYVGGMKKTILYVLKYHSQLPQWFDQRTQELVFEYSEQKWRASNPHVVEEIELTE